MTDPSAASSPPEAPAAGPAVRRPSAPDDVWAAVKADYLSGLSAPACCRRHGVGLSTLRDRAAREGWRRADQPWSPPNRLDPDDEGVQLEIEVSGDLDKVDYGQLAYVAHRRLMRAVMRGDAGEALRWRRLRDLLDIDQAEVDRWIDQDEALRARYGPPGDPDGLDGPDGSDGVLQSGPPSAPHSGRPYGAPGGAGSCPRGEGRSDGAAGQD